MSVIIETTLGDITVDLYVERRPRCCINFLKLCKMKYYNFNLFHTVRRGFIAQTGDPKGSGDGGESIWGVLEGDDKRYFQSETNPRIKHSGPGLFSFVGDKDGMLGSQFFVTLGDELSYLDGEHCVFGEIVDGVEIIHALNEVISDEAGRPFQDVRVTHTIVLCDPYEDPPGLVEPATSPERTEERMQGGRIAADEDIDEEAGMSAIELAELRAEREARARATILEMVGDIPDANVAPPENVLFVCKLNPVTTDQDLEIIFSRFGKVVSCEVIRDRKTGDSLQYAFVEFENEKSCEEAYFKMDNVLIDDRRIHVDFSQSVAKVRWFGRGRIEYQKDVSKQEFGKGEYEKNKKSTTYKRNSKDYKNEKSKDSLSSRDRQQRDKRDKREDFEENRVKGKLPEKRSYNEPYRYSKHEDRSKRTDRYKESEKRRNRDSSDERKPRKKYTIDQSYHKKYRTEYRNESTNIKRSYKDSTSKNKRDRYEDSSIKHVKQRRRSRSYEKKVEKPIKRSKNNHSSDKEELKRNEKKYKAFTNKKKSRRRSTSSSSSSSTSSSSSSSSSDSKRNKSKKSKKKYKDKHRK